MGRLKEALQLCIQNDHHCEGGIYYATGVHRPILSRFRRNRCSLKLETIEKLIDYFEIELVIPDRLKHRPKHKTKYTRTAKWHESQGRQKVKRSDAFVTWL